MQIDENTSALMERGYGRSNCEYEGKEGGGGGGGNESVLMVSVLVTEAVEEDEEESHGLHLMFGVQFVAGTCLELPEKNLKKKGERKIE